MYHSNTLNGLTMRFQSLAKSDKMQSLGNVTSGLRVKRILIDGIPTWCATWHEKAVN